jgi:hypothetical protein
MPETKRWEQGKSESVLNDFRKCYADPTLSLKLIAANFDMCSTIVHDVAARLGCPSRPIRSVSSPNKKKEAFSLCQLDVEIEEHRKRLEDLERKKLEMTVRATRVHDEIIIYGLSEPITRSVQDLIGWLKAGGPQKIRQLIREDEWK